MTNVRRLQYIAGQYLLNVPVELVRNSGWSRGDYIEIQNFGHRKIRIERIATHDTSRTDAHIQPLYDEALALFSMVSTATTQQDATLFSWHLSRFAYVCGKMRRLRMQSETPIGRAVETAT